MEELIGQKKERKEERNIVEKLKLSKHKIRKDSETERNKKDK